MGKPICLKVVPKPKSEGVDLWIVYDNEGSEASSEQVNWSSGPTTPHSTVLDALTGSDQYLKCEFAEGTTFELRSITLGTVHFARTAVVGQFDNKVVFLDYDQPRSGFLRLVRIPTWWGTKFPASGTWGWNLDSDTLPGVAIAPTGTGLFNRLEQHIPLAHVIEVRDFCRQARTDLRAAFALPNVGMADVRLILEHNSPLSGFCPLPTLERDGANLKLTRGELLLSAAFHSGWTPRIVDGGLVLIPSPIRGLANNPPTVDNLKVASELQTLEIPPGGMKVVEFLKTLESKVVPIPLDVHPQLGASWLDPVRVELRTNRTLFQLLDLVCAMTDARWDWTGNRVLLLPGPGSYGRRGSCS